MVSSELLAACREFPTRNGRRITFEYVLLGGVNDTLADARRLAKLLRGIPAKVNLIPYNPNPGLPFVAPPPERRGAGTWKSGTCAGWRWGRCGCRGWVVCRVGIRVTSEPTAVKELERGDPLWC